MTIIFRDKTNRFIGNLVGLAWEQLADHNGNWLYVHTHDPRQLINNKPSEDEIAISEPPLSLGILHGAPITHLFPIQPTDINATQLFNGRR